MEINKDFGGINQRVGKQLGMSVKDVKNYFERAKRIKGFSFDLSSGNNEGLNINLPGDAKLMLGLSIIDKTNSNFTLLINNDIAVNAVNTKFLSDIFTDSEYYYLPRPLSGSDDIEVSFNGVVDAGNAKIAIYYI